jgi:hypothetical protein
LYPASTSTRAPPPAFDPNGGGDDDDDGGFGGLQLPPATADAAFGALEGMSGAGAHESFGLQMGGFGGGDVGSMSFDDESLSQSALGSALTAVVPGVLYIGAFKDVADPIACATHRIDAFLCAAAGLTHPLPPHASRRSRAEDDVAPPPFLHLPMQDKPGQELEVHITAACAFIDAQAAAGRRVAVYCQAGRSRSASIAASYLMHVNPTLSAAEAVDALRLAYPRADPNMGFLAKIASPALLAAPASAL